MKFRAGGEDDDLSTSCAWESGKLQVLLKTLGTKPKLWQTQQARHVHSYTLNGHNSKEEKDSFNMTTWGRRPDTTLVTFRPDMRFNFNRGWDMCTMEQFGLSLAIMILARVYPEGCLTSCQNYMKSHPRRKLPPGSVATSVSLSPSTVATKSEVLDPPNSATLWYSFSCFGNLQP